MLVVMIGLFLSVLIGKSKTLYLREKILLIIFLAVICSSLR